MAQRDGTDASSPQKMEKTMQKGAKIIKKNGSLAADRLTE
jgi:hypothetical protein